MNRTHRRLGNACLSISAFLSAARAKSFSLASSGAFAEFGRGTVLEPPIRIEGAGRISIGSNVFVGRGSWIQTIGDLEGDPALFIGSGTAISGLCVLSAAQSIRIGTKVLMARNVFVTDHNHAFETTGVPILDQGITTPRPVEIGDGAWLGENVVITAGVRVGRGAVIGANAVVVRDVPDFSVAVGAPARVVRSFGGEVETDASTIAGLTTPPTRIPPSGP